MEIYLNNQMAKESNFDRLFNNWKVKQNKNRKGEQNKINFTISYKITTMN